MFCYKDRTFCKDWKNCKDGEDCSLALTDKVWEDAEKADMPIAMTERRSCFKERK